MQVLVGELIIVEQKHVLNSNRLTAETGQYTQFLRKLQHLFGSFKGATITNDIQVSARTWKLRVEIVIFGPRFI